MTPWTLTDALQVLHSQYPGAFVTSGKRDPNSSLGRANPHSYHNVGEAFDIRPMQGVDFGTYVSRLKSSGLPVVEAMDEQKNPKPWTTGPNWHIAFAGDKKVATSPIDLIRRAQAFNVDIPGASDAAPGPMTAATPAAAPAQGFDIQKLLAMLPQERPLEDKKKIPLWATILGVLGDAYTGNMAFSKSVAAQNGDIEDRNLAREKLNEQIQSDRVSLLAKLMGPEQGQDEYTRALIASGIRPGTPEYAQHMGQRASILENPPRYVMVNGALVQVGGGSTGLPTRPVGALTPYTGN